MTLNLSPPTAPRQTGIANRTPLELANPPNSIADAPTTQTALVTTLEDRIRSSRSRLTSLESSAAVINVAIQRTQSQLDSAMSDPANSRSLESIVSLSENLVNLGNNLEQAHSNINLAITNLQRLEQSARMPATSPIATPEPSGAASYTIPTYRSPSLAPPVPINAPQILRALPVFSSDDKTKPTQLITTRYAFMARLEMVLASMKVPQSVWNRFLPLVCNQLHFDWIILNLASPSAPFDFGSYIDRNQSRVPQAI